MHVGLMFFLKSKKKIKKKQRHKKEKEREKKRQEEKEKKRMEERSVRKGRGGDPVMIFMNYR